MPDLPKLTLVLGGTRSGKSTFAERMVVGSGSARTYLATAEALDDEMATRIRDHKDARDGWTTIEEPLDIAGALAKVGEGVVLLDCLTMWLSNQMHHGKVDISAMVAALRTAPGPLVCVSNEVGMGLVPDTALGRDFRDLQGALNAAVAGAADQVFFVAAGLPITLKSPT